MSTLQALSPAPSHPFYTGKSRVVDTAGRVEQFRRRYGDTMGKRG